MQQKRLHLHAGAVALGHQRNAKSILASIKPIQKELLVSRVNEQQVASMTRPKISVAFTSLRQRTLSLRS